MTIAGTLSEKVPTVDITTTQSPFIAERNLPQWEVSAHKNFQHPRAATPIEAKSYIDGCKLQIPVYIRNSSQRESPGFSLIIHVQPPFHVVQVFDENGYPQGEGEASQLSRPDYPWKWQPCGT